jgi:DNA-binding transcriptional ArsR family regulator
MSAADRPRRPVRLGPPAPPPDGWPSWFDPDRDVLLTPRQLRGLVHPIRVRLLYLLQTDGPATASQLGRRIGQSSGVTSYHLRTLADLGFVEDDPERGNGRDRWWRATHRATGFTFRSPDDPGDAETIELAERYMGLVVDTHHQRMTSYVDSLSARQDELWTLPWTFSASAIELTHDEARALAAQVLALVQQYRREPGQPPRGSAARAVFQFQLLPDDPPGGSDDGTEGGAAGEAAS